MRPGKIRCGVLLACALFATVPTSAQGKTTKGPECRIEISLDLQGEHSDLRLRATSELAGVLRFRTAESETALSLDAATDPVLARLAADRSWFSSVEIPGFWGPEQILNVGPDCAVRAHSIPLWPTGRIAGEATVKGKPKNASRRMTTELVVRLRARNDGPDRRPRPVGRVTCPVDPETSRWSCDLPATRLDLAFSAEGFAPIYRRGVRVEAGARRDLAPLVLAPGASMAGFVEVDGGTISESCLARVRPMRVGANQPRGSDLAAAAQTTVVDPRGFFQVTGLASGSYSLEIEQPGFASQKLFPIELVEGRETFLREPIVLRRPLDIEILVSPHLDWLDAPWRVSLMRASSQSSRFEEAPVFAGPASASGRVLVPDQPPGRYFLTVADTEGNTFHSDLMLQVRDAHDLPVRVDLDLVVVEGELLLGGRPVSGILVFGGRHGFRSIRVPVDADGFFRGVLPQEGTWTVDVSSHLLELETTVEVEVDVGPSGRALLDIDLPDTQIFGRVVDSGGRLVEGALVTLATESGSIRATSNPEGEIELLAVPEGTGWITAKRETLEGRQTSQSLLVTVVEGQPTGPLVLQLLDNMTFRGLVSGPLGAVAGADVRLRPEEPPLPITVEVETAIDGTFTAELPRNTKRIAAVVSAPGHALAASSLAVSVEEPESLRVAVPARGGTLELSSTFAEEPNPKSQRRLEVFQGGHLLSFQTLYEWAMAHGGEIGPRADGTMAFTLPRMAAGSYRLCLRPLRASEPAEGASSRDQLAETLRELGECVTGFLSEGGVLSHRFGPVD